MTTDLVGATGGLLAATATGGTALVEYGLVGLVAWLVVRESFAFARYVSERRGWRRNGGCSDHDAIVNLQAEVRAIRERLVRLEE